MTFEVFPHIKDAAKIKTQVSGLLNSSLRLVCWGEFHGPGAQVCT